MTVVTRESRRKLRKQRIKKALERLDQLGKGRPRLIVSRSNKRLFAQIVWKGKTVISAVTEGKTLTHGTQLGQKIGALAKEKGITEVMFDRNGYRYHGRVKAIADGARESLSF